MELLDYLRANFPIDERAPCAAWQLGSVNSGCMVISLRALRLDDDDEESPFVCIEIAQHESDELPDFSKGVMFEITSIEKLLAVGNAFSIQFPSIAVEGK